MRGKAENGPSLWDPATHITDTEIYYTLLGPVFALASLGCCGRARNEPTDSLSL